MKNIYDQAIQECGGHTGIAVVGLELTDTVCAARYTLWDEENHRQDHPAILAAGQKLRLPTALAWAEDGVRIGEEALLEPTCYTGFWRCQNLGEGFGGDISAPSYRQLMKTFFRQLVKQLRAQNPRLRSATYLLVQVNLPVGRAWRKRAWIYEELLNEALKDMRGVAAAVADPVEAIVASSWPFYKEQTVWALRLENGRYHAFRLKYRFPEHQEFYFYQTEDFAADRFEELPEMGFVITDEYAAVHCTARQVGSLSLGLALIGRWRLMQARAERWAIHRDEDIEEKLREAYVSAGNRVLDDLLRGAMPAIPKGQSIRQGLMTQYLPKDPVENAAAFLEGCMWWKTAQDMLEEMLDLFAWRVPKGYGHCAPYDLDLRPHFSKPKAQTEGIRAALDEIYKRKSTIRLPSDDWLGSFGMTRLENKGLMDAVPADPEVARKVFKSMKKSPGRWALRDYGGIDARCEIEAETNPLRTFYDYMGAYELCRQVEKAARAMLKMHFDNYAPFTIRYPEEAEKAIPKGLLE